MNELTNVLIIGSQGMLGKMLVKEFSKCFLVKTVARNGADINIDLASNLDTLKNHINSQNYDVIINAAAIVNLEYCENHPDYAYLINTRLPALLSEWSEGISAYFIHISTDHYFADKEKYHKENAEVKILNEYARTKYLAERLVLLNKEALVIRTNLVGFRNQKDRKTFVEWVIDEIRQNSNINGFTNVYTSSLDVKSFAVLLRDIISNKRLMGLYNIASQTCISKYEFIYKLACLFEKQSLVKKVVSPSNGAVNRCVNMGLCVKKALNEGVNLPYPDDVIKAIYKQYKGEVE